MNKEENKKTIKNAEKYIYKKKQTLKSIAKIYESRTKTKGKNKPQKLSRKMDSEEKNIEILLV